MGEHKVAYPIACANTLLEAVPARYLLYRPRWR